MVIKRTESHAYIIKRCGHLVLESIFLIQKCGHFFGLYDHWYVWINDHIDPRRVESLMYIICKIISLFHYYSSI